LERHLTKVPALHYPSFSVPWVIYPGSRHSVKASYTVLRHLERTRKLSHVQGTLQSYIYYAELEEQFLRTIAHQLRKKWGWDAEAGVREMKSMSFDIGKFVADVELRENVKAELQLREWVRLNPGVKYLAQGTRMPRKQRKEMRLWRMKVDAIKREQKARTRRSAFMREWFSGLGRGSSISVFQHPRGRLRKRRAKRLRRIKLGKKLL